MGDREKTFVAHDPDTGLPVDFDPIQGEPDLAQRVRNGELTSEQADALLQAAGRRRAAERGPDLDTDEEGLTTQSGFGTGQGMDSQSHKSGKDH